MNGTERSDADKVEQDLMVHIPVVLHFFRLYGRFNFLQYLQVFFEQAFLRGDRFQFQCGIRIVFGQHFRQFLLSGSDLCF